MIEHEIIPVFSRLWFIMNSIALIVLFTIISFGRKLTSNRAKVYLGVFIGVVLFVRCVITHPYQIYIGKWVLASSLPLHLCGISAILSSFLLFRFNQFLYEFLILLGIPGAIQSLVTPEFTLGIDSFFLVEYYVSHVGIILSGLYLTFVLNKKPRIGSWKMVIIRFQIVLIGVHLINILLNSNYIYTRIKPLANNPLIIGDWPYYYIGFEVIGIFNIILFYYLFRNFSNKYNPIHKNEERVLT